MLNVICSRDNFLSYLQKNKKQRKHVFYDIETLTVNKQTEKPSELLSLEYIVVVSFIMNDEINYFFLPNLKSFIKELGKVDSKVNIDLTGQFIHGYDNHFLLRALVELGYKPVNMERKEINVPMFRESEKSDNIVECLRVKRKSSISLKFSVNSMNIQTVDLNMKSNAKLATMGKKLLNLGLIHPDYLKLDDYDYTLYDKQKPFSLFDLENYCEGVYKGLSDRQLQYVRNDGIIMPLYYYHYKELYPGYDYKKMTLSQNIMSDYDTSNLATLQLKNIFSSSKNEELNAKQRKEMEVHIRYSEYNFHNINLYYYIKATYSGGLVLYNDRHVGNLIKRGMKYVDLNSSYPFTMYKYEVPTYLTSHGWEKTLDKLDSKGHYSIFRMDIDVFNFMILDIKSRFVRCALVKYLYKGKDDITINSNTLLLLKDFGVDLKKYKCIDYITYETKRFASYKKLEEFYSIKQQAKSKFLLNTSNIEDIKVTNTILDKLESTQEEIYLAKVSMNGVSGLPALRATYPVYLLGENGDIESYQTGFTNKERNCVFSAFVTSRSFYHLLKPLRKLSPDEIDEYVYYTDTDSLIVDNVVVPKLDMKFHPDNLGQWDIEHHISKLYVSNNKMYCLETDKGDIVVKSCGVVKGIFDKHTNSNHPEFEKIDLETFVDRYFKIGSKLPNTKHVLNKYGTISIYDSITEIKPANKCLPQQIYKKTKRVIERIKEEVRNAMDNENFDDSIYIESNYGVLSISECLPDVFSADDTKPIEEIIALYNLAKIYTR